MNTASSASRSAPPRWRVAVLHGGPSTEHDISVVTARGVIASLHEGGHEAAPVWVDKTGRWHFTAPGPAADAGVASAHPLAAPEALIRLRDSGIDCAFLAFHGTYGEDGRVQGALELAGVPYTGSRVTATALAMDKPLTRRVLASVGIAVPEALEFTAAELAQAGTADAVVAALGLPVVVKVAAGGSSLGVEIPRTRAELDDALARLSRDSDVVLCERYVAGVELTAGVLVDDAGALEALPVVEIAPKGEGFFDYAAKYDPTLTDEIVPARVTPAVEAECRRIGLLAHRVLGCRAISRTDLILDAEGTLWALETNTLPGLTPASLVPKSAAAASITYLGLLERVIAASIREAG